MKSILPRLRFGLRQSSAAFLCLLCSLCFLLLNPAHAQTNAEPPVPPQLTNTIVTGVGLVDFALNLWPSIDPTLTNTFGSGEFELKVGLAYKSLASAGVTPFMVGAGEYYFARNFGVGADVITFGNGAGTSTVDSTSIYFLGRIDRGNIALYGLLGVEREFNGLQTPTSQEAGRWDGRGGIGLEYRYRTKIGISLDSSLLAWGTKSTETGFLTRLAATYHF